MSVFDILMIILMSLLSIPMVIGFYICICLLLAIYKDFYGKDHKL